MLPLFVCEGEGVRRGVVVPGVFNLSVDEAVKEARAAAGDGVRSVLFGLPITRIRWARSTIPEPVQSAVRAIKREVPGVLATDVPLRIPDHGHCGIIVTTKCQRPTVEQLVRAAISRDGGGRHRAVRHDGRRVGAIRQALDERGFETRRSWRMRPNTGRCSTDRSARPPTRRRNSRPPVVPRWIRRMRTKRCARWNRTSGKARISSW